jgi:tetraacyldisaccharide-1-P 4'-kinase
LRGASASDRVSGDPRLGSRTIANPRVGSRAVAVACLAVAAIAKLERFFSDVRPQAGTGGLDGFRDHHYFTQSDIRKIDKAARAAAAAIILTTEKDAVRLETCDLIGLPFAAVPLIVGIEPAEPFREWLLGRIR